MQLNMSDSFGNSELSFNDNVDHQENRQNNYLYVRTAIERSLNELFTEEDDLVAHYESLPLPSFTVARPPRPQIPVTLLNNLYPTPSTENRSPHIIHDISFIDFNIFSPGCIVCQLQFKGVFRDYVVPMLVQQRNHIEIGSFLITLSHLDPKTIDMGVVTNMYSVDEFLDLKRILGRSQDQEENFIGVAIRVADIEERMYLPAKWEREIQTLAYARQVVIDLGLQMDLYEVEYQYDGKVLYLYYTAGTRVDYRELVHVVSRACNGIRVKMKKTNQCRQFVPFEFASVGLATGYLPTVTATSTSSSAELLSEVA